MKIEYVPPKSKSTFLGNLAQGAVFKFAQSNEVFLALGYDGYDLCQMEVARNGWSRSKVAECRIKPVSEELYSWTDEADRLDLEFYEDGDEMADLVAYMDLGCGSIYMSHKDEVIIVLEATLSVKEKM